MHIDLSRPVQAQVTQIEKRLGTPSLESMLVYPKEYCSLGTHCSSAEKTVARKIFKAFGSDGFGEVFRKYLPYLKHEMQTFPEPLLRIIGLGRLQNINTLPLEADMMENYRMPNCPLK